MCAQARLKLLFQVSLWDGHFNSYQAYKPPHVYSPILGVTCVQPVVVITFRRWLYHTNSSLFLSPFPSLTLLLSLPSLPPPSLSPAPSPLTRSLLLSHRLSHYARTVFIPTCQSLLLRGPVARALSNTVRLIKDSFSSHGAGIMHVSSFSGESAFTPWRSVSHNNNCPKAGHPV